MRELIKIYGEDAIASYVCISSCMMSSCPPCKYRTRVKSCYKIKIDSRVLVCCFYGGLL